MLLHFILFVILTSYLTLMAVEGANYTTNNNIAKAGCPTHCGNVTVPYPFGIANGCFLDDYFSLFCNNSSQPPTLFFGEEKDSLQIYSISDSEMRVPTKVTYSCYNQSGSAGGLEWTSSTSWITTYSSKNKFTVIGCDDYALIAGENDFTSGCFGLCRQPPTVLDGQCLGVGCCQISIPKYLTNYTVTLDTFKSHSDVLSFNECGYGFLVEEGKFQFGGASDLSMSHSDFVKKIESTMPRVFDWVIAPDGNCTVEVNTCKGNSLCYDVEGGGYRCKCNQGYVGNPYLDQGCQDIDECKDNGTYPCYGVCINTIGSYNCTCPLGFFGDANTRGGCKEVIKDSKSALTIIIIVVVSSMLVLLFGIVGICCGIRKRKLMKLREKFFEQNGGVLLKQKIKSQGSHEAMTLFSTEQLRKATDNYSLENIIGKGGYGVVYKGVLSDERIVAIKKSRLVDVSQAEQFINEVMILTQVIHRNVVKLLGCCLEEQVPVLVYEFISNNTLFHHIHHKLGGTHWLSWDNRLRVAVEAASALGYLHSDITVPIIHRDVKSTNILIDENYTAKIADFGASRLIPVDHEQVTTLIQGTLGYLDPEYLNLSQLTEKSDVYSFGVVLAELITGKNPIGAERINEEKILATYFVKSVKENRLFEIVEPRILREATLEQLEIVGHLVKRCLSFIGDDRPTMREVAVELEGLRKFTTHPWAQQQTSKETRSSTLEVEQPDLYDVPLIGSNEWESYSGITEIDVSLGRNNPR